MAIKKNKKVKEAVNHYNELSGDEEVKRLAEVRLMAQLEEKAALASARAKGEERGLKIGEERGLKIGEERGLKIGEERGLKIGEERGLKLGKADEKKEIAKKMKNKNMPINEIVELTGLTKEEIEKI